MSLPQTPKDAAGLPVGAVYVPNSTFLALQGSPLSLTDGASNASAGVVSADQLLAAIVNGQSFIASTGSMATATNPNLTMGLSVFNPSSSGKSLYVYSIKWSLVSSNATTTKYHITQTNPSYPNPITPINLKGGGGASVASVTSAANGATASLTTLGTLVDFFFNSVQGTFELLSPGTGIVLPAGSNYGVAVYGVIVTATSAWGASIRWIEF